MHIEENMFISKTLFCQDPLIVGDHHLDLPLAHHLQVGVDVNINPPPPLPLSNFIILCISLLARWRSSSYQHINTAICWQHCYALILEWEKQSLLEMGWNTTNLENCAQFVLIFLPLGDKQHQDLPLGPLQVCCIEDYEVCDSSIMPS